MPFETKRPPTQCHHWNARKLKKLLTMCFNWNKPEQFRSQHKIINLKSLYQACTPVAHPKLFLFVFRSRARFVGAWRSMLPAFNWTISNWLDVGAPASLLDVYYTPCATLSKAWAKSKPIPTQLSPISVASIFSLICVSKSDTCIVV